VSGGLRRAKRRGRERLRRFLQPVLELSRHTRSKKQLHNDSKWFIWLLRRWNIMIHVLK
jgi:hypothetical protein